MSKKIKGTAKLVYKLGAWTVSLNGKKLGRAVTLGDATHLLYINGAKVYSYHRGKTKSDKPTMISDVLMFDYISEGEN